MSTDIVSIDEKLHIFCDKLNIPHFSDDELTEILKLKNKIIHILMYDTANKDYNTYVNDILDYVAVFKNNLGEYLNGFNESEAEQYLSRGETYSERCLGIDDFSNFDKTMFRLVMLDHYFKKNLLKYILLKNDRRIYIEFKAAPVFYMDMHNAISMFIGNYSCDKNKGYIFEALNEQRLLPEISELYNLINQFKSKLLKRDELKQLILNKKKEYFNDLLNYKNVQLAYINIQESDNKEVTRLFRACVEKISHDYKNIIIAATESEELKNIFPEFDNLSIILDCKFISKHTIVQIIMCRKGQTKYS